MACLENVGMGFEICGQPAAEHWHEHLRHGERYAHGHVAYCERHGGQERAQAESEQERRSCWHGLAPPHLTREEVETAGAMGLSSEHAYVVLRMVDGPRWTAGLGLGLGGRYRDLRGSWPTEGAAELAAVRSWRRYLDAAVATIRSARGGTLEWGRPLEPRKRPLVVRLRGPGMVDDAALAAAEPSVVDLDRPPPAEELLALDKYERRALRRARAGQLRDKERGLLRAVLAQAELLGVQLPDADALRVAARER